MGKNNVNPNHYKVAGRERQGEDILQGPHKQKLTQSRSSGRRGSHGNRERPALVPGPPPQGAAPVRAKTKAVATHDRRTDAAKAGRSKQVSGRRSTARRRAAS